jgi:hypothetical protein
MDLKSMLWFWKYFRPKIEDFFSNCSYLYRKDKIITGQKSLRTWIVQLLVFVRLFLCTSIALKCTFKNQMIKMIKRWFLCLIPTYFCQVLYPTQK